MQGFSLVGTIGALPARAMMRHGVLDCTDEWRSFAQRLVDDAARFERGGHTFSASLDADPLTVFVTLLRCPVSIVHATVNMASTAASRSSLVAETDLAGLN